VSTDEPLLEGITLKLVKFWVDKVYSGVYDEETEKKKKQQLRALLGWHI
jgi:hypothetical protein